MSALSRYITNQLNTNGYTMDALDKALANASLNARMNGDTLHTENLDSIADPALDQFDPSRDGVLRSKTASSNPRTEFELLQNYQQQMESEYAEKAAASNAASSSIHRLSVLTQVISDKTNWIQQQLTEVYAQLSRIETTITTAAQSMPESPSHKHRSLHEWEDQYLINELVERENNLMPFYYELLKRIGSPELQKLVMSSMQGKNTSMVTLAQLCSALAPQTIQPQYPHISEAQRNELKPRSGADRVVHEQIQYVPTPIPQQQYFGQAT